MSSYRGAWDGGPPGAEAEYAAPSRAPPLPATDPWTGARYAPYAAAYDYSAYSSAAPAPAPAYASYGVDPAYYRAPDAAYYGKYPEQPAPYTSGGASTAAGYAPPQPRHDHVARRSVSRSASPYYARSPPPQPRRRRRSASPPPSARSRSRSRSHSRSHSRSSTPQRSRRRSSVSSESSNSDKSYKRKARGRGERSDRSSTPSPRPRLRSPSPSSPASRGGSRRSRRRDASTPPRKKRDSFTPPKAKRNSRSPTPPRRPRRKEADRERSLTPPRSYKIKERRVEPPPRKVRDSSVTPPKSYARSASSSSSKSGSVRRRRAASSRSTHSSSNSRSSGSARSRSRSASRRKQKHRSRSRSKRRSRSGSGSRSNSHSSGGTPSDDERRGQFTVADRKRFWKMHKSRQEERDRRTPPAQEVKLAPPPGAIESTTVDDIEYGDPPDLEGPNFAELLPSAALPPDRASSMRTRVAPPALAASGSLPIKNDGSFLEMFKKMQEQTKKTEEAEKKPEIKKPAYPFIGKRRGGRVLKTGLVKKAKAIDERTAEGTPKDAWSLYMQEVKKYRETSCEEERKTRPLVK